MMEADIAGIYRDYIACLNAQDWPKLMQFVHDEVSHNGRQLGVSGYRAMLENDFREIPTSIFRLSCWSPSRPISRAG
jgi:predicted ester cyclase